MTSTESRRNVRVTPFEAGLVLGLGAAVVQGFYEVVPPMAYGVCLVGHPRDLVNWVANAVAGASWPVTLPWLAYPLLTAVGVVLGAGIAARQHGEFAFRKARKPLRYVGLGFLMVNFGLMLGGCPIRTLLLAAYGDPYGAVAWVLIILGVAATTVLLRRRARRGTGKAGAR